MTINVSKFLSPTTTNTTKKIDLGKFGVTPKVVKQTTVPKGPNPFATPIETYKNYRDYPVQKPDLSIKLPTKMSESTNPSGTKAEAEDYTKSSKQLYQPTVDSYNDFTSKLKEVINVSKGHNDSVSKAVGNQLKALTSGVGLLFSPASTLFGAAGNIPGSGGIPGKVANKVFETAGNAGKWAGEKSIDILPLSQESKNNLKEAAGDVGSLFGQIALGGLSHGILGKVMPKEVIDGIHHDYVNNVKTESLVEESLGKITKEKAKEIAINAAEKTISKLDETKKISDTENNLKLMENIPAPAPGMVRVYQTGLNNDGVIKPGSYVDTKVNEHINRGTPAEGKIYHDIPEDTFNDMVSHIDDAKTQAGIYNVKNEMKGTLYSDVGETTPKMTYTPKIAKDFTQEYIDRGLLPDNFDDLPQVEKYTFADQAEKSVRLVSEEPERAARVLAGEEPLPSEIKPGFFLKAMNDFVLNNPTPENIDLLRKSPLMAESSSHAGALASYRALSPDDPVNAISSVEKARTKNVEKVRKITETEIKQSLKESMRKTAPKIKDWAEFIDSIKCK